MHSLNYLVYLSPVVFILIFVKIQNAYDGVIKDVRLSYDTLFSEGLAQRNKSFDLIVGLLISISICFFYYRYTETNTTYFLVALGSACYTDVLKKWIPDQFIYLLCWVAAYHLFVEVSELDRFYQILSGLTLLFFFISMNVVSKQKVIHTGDLYLLFSIGVYFSLAAVYIFTLVTLLLAFSHMKITKKTQLPFVPYIYIAFISLKVLEYESVYLSSFLLFF